MATRTNPTPSPALVTPAQLHSRERFRAQFREAITREADAVFAKVSSSSANSKSDSNNNAGDDSSGLLALSDSIHGLILNINRRYHMSSRSSIIMFEWDMHDLWFQLTHAARVTGADDPAQDRLVGQVLFARELGTLRRNDGSGEEEEAVTRAELGGGRIWTDLPFLVEDLIAAWEGFMSGGGNRAVEERRNLAALIAKMVALGICESDLSFCAVRLLRKSPGEGESEVSMADLLPACVVWFRYCSHKLLTLSVKNQAFGVKIGVDEKLWAPGELARNAKVERAGLSVSRWLFWRQRFKDLARCGDEKLVEMGRQGFSQMISTGKDMGYEIAGETSYEERLQQALLDELKRSGKNCVEQCDIVVDLDWTG